MIDKRALVVALSIVFSVIFVDVYVTTALLDPSPGELGLREAVARSYLYTVTTHSLLLIIIVIMINTKVVVLKDRG